MQRYLSAYGVLERWGERPPGRSDPRYWEAMTVIGSEHAKIDRDLIEKPRGESDA